MAPRGAATDGAATATATEQPAGTHWVQKRFALPPYPRGCHVVTKHIYDAVPELGEFELGLAHIFGAWRACTVCWHARSRSLILGSLLILRRSAAHQRLFDHQ
jgi:hypothetical protein